MRFTISLITPNYPTISLPEYGIFVKNTVDQWEDNDCLVQVIHPCSISNALKRIGKKSHKLTKKNASEFVTRPLCISFSNKKVGPLKTISLSRSAFVKASRRAQRGLAIPNAFYGKFLMNGGRAAVELGKKYNRPAFVDLGESSLLQGFDKKDRSHAEQILQQASGVVCVSQRLAEEAITLGANPKDILLRPNQVDTSIFTQTSQKQAREILGLSQDQIIGVFAGHFIERKGPLRVLEALNRLPIQNAKCIFLGRGPQKPEGERVLFTGPVEHGELPIWLNAADFFVLPTLAEGNCNAINEAQAVGLPVITSDILDTEGQVPENTGIRVNPNDIDQLARSILKLASDPQLLNDFRDETLKIAEERNKKDRSSEILEWIKSKSFPDPS